jgi:preprotein translocase subunit SecD
MPNSLLNQWRIWLLLVALAVSVLAVFFGGISFGIDFSGGTSFQVKLAEPVSDADQKEQIRSIIEQRLNFTGLRDATVTFVGNDLVFADIAETNPEQVRQLESLLLRQGKFEATLDQNVLFTGSDFQVIKDPGRGYGLRPLTEGGAQWVLPFLLKPAAAQRFTDLTFHQCDAVGVGANGQREYDCKNTYFFIDRPQESVLIFTRIGFSEDEALMKAGNRDADIPANSQLSELLLNAGVLYVVLDANSDQNNSAAWNQLLSIVKANPNAVIPSDLPESIQAELQSRGFSLKPVQVPQGIPFAWQATGARSVISLTAGVTNLDPYVANPRDAKVFSELVIQGTAPTQEDAQNRLNSLTILLQSGSLPIAVDSISQETISPLLGKRFLQDALGMGIVALIVIMLIIFIRYRRFELSVSLGFISLSEVVIVLGFAALVRWNLDLASMAGIIAAIGTGVNQQIIITDEVLLYGMQRETTSVVNRGKRALFIIVASAATVVATMAPVVFFGFGLGKLVGFAVTTIAGVLVGILITRPAYSEFAKFLAERQKKEE